MIITSSAPTASLNGLKANSFQLTNSAKIIDIVINKMYTNKPGAVIRELASNAWDAHCAAGNQAKPFEIHLPTWLSKTFMIRDYGTGIPHDKFENIYTNIGGSTKDGNDDFIGGFGLGSKTPFTMVDSFTVENWYDNIKSTWLCFKDSGNPQVTLLSKETSTEPSGLKVSFIFEDDVVGEFTDQITKQLKYFPVKPLITGGSMLKWEELPDGWETKDYFFERSSRYSWNNSSHRVVMGNVNYLLDPNELGNELSTLFEDTSLTLKVDIGSVDIPPSRENLEYTTRTKKFLSDKLRDIKTKFNNDFKEEVKDITSYLELRKKFFSANSSLLTMKEFVFKGVTYPTGDLNSGYLGLGELPELSFKIISCRHMNIIRPATSVSMLKVIDGLTVYINDLGVGASRHINEKVNRLPTGLLFVDPVKGTKATRQSLFDKTFKITKEFFGKDPILLSTLIGMPVTTTTTRTKANQIFKIVTHAYKVKEMTATQDTIPTTGYFLPLVGWNVTGDFEGKLPLLSRFVDELDMPVYLVRKDSLKNVVCLQGEKELQKALDKLLIPKIQARVNQEYLREQYDHYHLRLASVVNWKGINNTLHLLIRAKERRINGDDLVGLNTNSLIKQEIKPNVLISARTRSLLETHSTSLKPLIEVVTGRYHSRKDNLITLQTFIKQENK